jgi:hypothetical protein
VIRTPWFFISSKYTKQWTLPVTQPERGATLEVRLNHKYWNILNESYTREEVLRITPEGLFEKDNSDVDAGE